MKSLLATDYDESKLVFPVGVQPKIDGVRGQTSLGSLTGRRLKKHKNLYTTEFYSRPEYVDLDGELAAGPETHPDLCRMTTSAVGTIKGEPFTYWHIFDTLNKHVVNAPYIDRYHWLVDYLESQHSRSLCLNAKLVPMVIVQNLEQLNAAHDLNMQSGYEGTILRRLNGRYKEGRSTVNEGLLLRIKDFIDAEFLISGLTEGDTNENEAQINELGQTFRSSHQENKVPNGMIGSFQGYVIGDVKDPQTGRILLVDGQPVTVSPGKMQHDKRKEGFENPQLYLEKIGKFKFFPKGHKDKPRFPIFQCLRSEEDM